MLMNPKVTFGLVLALSPLSAWACEACGCSETTAEAETVADEHEATCSFDQDREAILAMAGEYEVTFQFQETVGCVPGYELRDPYHSEATEWVEVLEDNGTYIAMQHILVVTNDEGEQYVVKHWRQDWTYEDTSLLEFRGNNTWERVTISEEQAQGTWSQAVYQVDDSPRYESYGRWEHLGERSAWESEVTWRPLPRREYTTRSDYQILQAVNRHVITPAGWVHEQDNQKLVLDAEGNPQTILSHESGLNVYDRTDDADFSAGHAYWEATQAYWANIREVWADVLSAERVEIQPANGVPLYTTLFAIAEDLENGIEYDDALISEGRNAIESSIVMP